MVFHSYCFEATGRKIAIYNLDSEADIYIVYADEKSKGCISYVVENTISTQKTIDYKKLMNLYASYH